MAEMEVKHTLVSSKQKLQEHINSGKVVEGTIAIDEVGNMYFVDRNKGIRDIANDSFVFENMDDLTTAIAEGIVTAGGIVTAKNAFSVYEQYIIQSDDGDILIPVPIMTVFKEYVDTKIADFDSSITTVSKEQIDKLFDENK